jgi:hypothetical protein
VSSKGQTMCLQSSSGGERRVKNCGYSWACSRDIENEAMTMEETMMEKLTVNNLPKWGQAARSLIIPTTDKFIKTAE